MNFFTWSQLALVCLLGAMSPGPSLALIIRNSINYNRLSGFLSSIGHGLGIGIYAFKYKFDGNTICWKCINNNNNFFLYNI